VTFSSISTVAHVHSADKNALVVQEKFQKKAEQYLASIFETLDRRVQLWLIHITDFCRFSTLTLVFAVPLKESKISSDAWMN
jgi:hypothetical protein